MMKKVIGIVTMIVIILLLSSGFFAEIVRFFAWLFILQYSQPETSVAGGIVVRILTFLVSYNLVGILFKCFNGKIMSVWYFIVSTLLGFAFAWIVWKIEQYIMIIGIILGVVAILGITFFIIWLLLEKKNNRKDGDNDN